MTVKLDVVTLTERESFTIARRRAGLTQNDLAGLTGIAQTVISRWEKDVMNISQKKIDALWTAVIKAEQNGEEQGDQGAVA